jgi:hypothetical protein
VFYFVLSVALFGLIGGHLGIGCLAAALAIVSGWLFAKAALSHQKWS